MTDPYVMGPPADYRPLPGPAVEHVDPKVQAEVNRRGMELVREVLAQTGVTTKARAAGTDTCPTHPEQRGGTTPAGDAWCPTCRRTPATTKETTR